MRLCLVTPFSWSQPHDVNEHVAGVAKALREIGHSVTVLASSNRVKELAAGRRALLDGLTRYASGAGRVNLRVREFKLGLRDRCAQLVDGRPGGFRLRLTDGDLLRRGVGLSEAAQGFVDARLRPADLRLRAPGILRGGGLRGARFRDLRFGGRDAAPRRFELGGRGARRRDGLVKSLPRNLVLREKLLVSLHVRVGARGFRLRARPRSLRACCRCGGTTARRE